MAQNPWFNELRERVRRKLGGKRIVLATTEDDIVEMVTSALSPLGIEVQVERDSLGAREAAAREATCLVLLRLKLPDVAGRHLLGFMRIRATADTPLIVLQRRGDPRVGQRELDEARVDRVLRVPCHESELLALLDAFWPEPRGR